MSIVPTVLLIYLALYHVWEWRKTQIPDFHCSIDFFTGFAPCGHARQKTSGYFFYHGALTTVFATRIVMAIAAAVQEHHDIAVSHVTVRAALARSPDVA
jgi:hypothetical protein